MEDPALSNSSDHPETEIQQNTPGDGNVVIGKVTGGNVFGSIGGNVIFTQPNSNSLQSYQLRNITSQKLLNMVGHEVSTSLEQSLHFVIDGLLNLPKADSPGQVNPVPHVTKPWLMAIEDERRQGFHILPEGVTIWNVFEQPHVNRQLLILGEPGSGKTTSKLEIAQNLVEKAKQDCSQPIPVLLNLSSWKKKHPISEWVLEELHVKYGISVALLGEWLISGQIFLLLDGLDEVQTDLQIDCSQQLNNWMTKNLERSPVGLVVCCRLEEYEMVVRQKLTLCWAVHLQPLKIAQIRKYLAHFELGIVANSVIQDRSLQELLSKPLFLSIFGFVVKQGLFNIIDWQLLKTSQEMQHYLLRCYWEAVMQRGLVSEADFKNGVLSKTYNKKSVPNKMLVLRALIFAAKGMGNETELLIEQIQPSWLKEKKEWWEYRLIVGSFIGLVIGFIIGFVVGSITGLIFGVIFGMIFCLFGDLFCTLIIRLSGSLVTDMMVGLDKIDPVEKISISASNNARRELICSLKSNLIFGITFGPIFGLTASLIVIPVFGLIKAIFSGLVLGLLLGIIRGVVRGTIRGIKADIQTRIEPNHGIKNSMSNTLIVTTITLIFSIPFKMFLQNSLTFGLIDPKIIPLIIEISISALIWISFREAGGQAFLQHLVLRTVLWHYRYAPCRYDLLLNYCSERLLLQRIGGRYRFMHRTLQEYFAAMPYPNK